MTLDIGHTIARLRHERAITQEALAAAIGVSAPAVSKWETGQSYPDITLLPPLARYFSISVDALLSYVPSLDDSQRDALFQALQSTFHEEGWAQGLARCQMLLREYPSDMALRILLASTLVAVMAYAPNAQAREDARALQIQWLQEATHTADGQTQLMAKNLLASLHLATGKLDEAETLLAELQDLETNARQVMPVLRMRQNRPEEAKALAEQNLLLALDGMQNAATLLVRIALDTGDVQTAMAYQQAARAAIYAFQLEGIFQQTMAQMALSIAHAQDDPQALLSATEAYAEAILAGYAQGAGPLFPSRNARIRENADPQLQQRLATLIADDLMTNEAYAAVRGDPRFGVLVEKLRRADAGEQF